MLGLQLATDLHRPDAWWPHGAAYAADFASDRYMREGLAVSRGQALSVARNSPKMIQNSAGQWQSVPANTLARSDLGASFEPASTNCIHNSAMVGAAAGAPGTIPTGWSIPTTSNGLTRQVTAVGSSNGMPYVDIRLSGTTTAENFINIDLVGSNFVAAANGQTWTLSCFLALAAGSFDGLLAGLGCRLRVAVRATGGAYLGELSSSPSISPTQTLTRFHQTATISNATAGVISPYIQVWYQSGQAINLTLRLSLPQLEQTSFVSSPIPTYGTAVARAADTVTLNSPSTTGLNVTTTGGSTEAISTPWTPARPYEAARITG